jgi:hypothetical protein
MKKIFVLCVFVAMALCVAVPAAQAMGNQTEMKVDRLIVNEAKIDKAEIRQAEIELANIKKVMANKVHIKDAEIKNLRVEMARFEQAHMEYVRIKQAEVDLLKVKLAEIETANIKTANIDTANINTANINKANIGSVSYGNHGRKCPEGQDCIPIDKVSNPKWQINHEGRLSGVTFIQGSIRDGLGCRIQSKWYESGQEVQVVATNCNVSGASDRLSKATERASRLDKEVRSGVKSRYCRQKNCYVCEH